MYTLTVKKEEAGKRLDLFISRKLPNISRSMIKKLIISGNVKVNNRTRFPHYTVKEGEVIEVTIPEPEKNVLKPLDLKLDIIFEDNDILVINKPPGLPVHPAAGHRDDTLVNALIAYLGEKNSLSTIGGIERPGIVHRLDKDTSGVLIIAKNDAAHIGLSYQFQSRRVKKIYEAILKGYLESDRGVIDKPIGRNPKNRKKFSIVENGRESLTYYEVVDRRGETTWVRFFPKTGRTHQLRVHSVSMGHPIIGDPLYSRGYTKYSCIALVARSITIEHPANKRWYTFIASYPEHFIEIAEDFGYNLKALKNENSWKVENEQT